MTAVEAIVIVLACAGGAALQAAAGFGFALLAAPVLIHVLGATEAVGTVGVLSVVVNTLTLTGPVRGGAHGAARPTVLTLELLRLAPPAAVGLVAGALLLGVVPDPVLQGALAIAVLAALALRQEPGVAAPPRGAWRVAAGAGAGVMTTTIGVNGPPLVLWLRARRATPGQTRDTLAVAFLVAGVATAVVLAALGRLQLGAPAVAGGAAGVIVGHALGRRQAAGMAVRRHARLVDITLAASALAAAVAALTS